MNKLEESWNKYKRELIARNYFANTNDRTFFQAGFNAAAKLFKKPNITSAIHSDGEGDAVYCGGCSFTHKPGKCPDGLNARR